MKNISIYYNLTSSAVNTQTILPAVTLKGKTSINFILTGINETTNYATYLDINYGDTAKVIKLNKDTVYDYKSNSIFDEILYGKIGGTILNRYEHTYINSSSSINTPLTAQFLITFRNGSQSLFIQPLNVYNSSYYDEIGDLSIVNTQISPTSSSNTFVNFEGKLNRQTYISILNITSRENINSLYANYTDPVYINPAPIDIAPIPSTYTLRINATQSIDSRILGKDPNIAKDIYTIQDHDNGIYIRNPNCWAYDIDLTSCSPWNDAELGPPASPYRRAGTLITPKHVIVARHYPLYPGNNIKFVTKDNIVITRQIIATQDAINPAAPVSYKMPDFTICLLNEAVPDTISFSKVLPETWNKFTDPSKYTYYYSYGSTLPQNTMSWPGDYLDNVPVLFLNQQERALVSELTYLDATTTFNTPQLPINPVFPYGVGIKLDYNPLLQPSRKVFCQTVQGGDSGNPIFLVINNEAILISLFFVEAGGDSIRWSRAFINKAIQDVDIAAGQITGYTLTDVDLTSFYQFSP